MDDTARGSQPEQGLQVLDPAVRRKIARFYSDENFVDSFEETLGEYNSFSTHYADSAEKLRHLIRHGPLSFTDMQERPEMFFLAHKLLAKRMCQGFGIRFTVQYNLFAGSILGLGTPEQVHMLDTFQEQGTLGCFALTEKSAGVLSGLIVETTAEWNPTRQQFLLHTPNENACKNWISQGLTAEYMVVIADLIVDGTSHGPHPFVCKMRVGGELIPGIQVGDMGVKTIANDLDNAWLRFTRVWMPKESLLAKYADIIDNKYVQVGKEKMRIEVIGQRLLTGRLVIAQACIFSIQDVFKKAKAYTSEKQCHVPGSELPLCELPQVKHLFREADAELQHMEQYLTQVQQRLAVHLSAGTIPPDSLVESIAVAKVKAIEVATNMSFRLSQEVGSYALMGSTGFEHQAMLLCCKFAEGDSRILLQKMARDRLKDFQNQSWFSMLADMFDADSRRELLLCASLGRALTSGPAVEVWNEQYEKVYGLAEMVCERHLKMHQSKL